MKSTGMPIWKRAVMRGALAAALLFAALGSLILIGKTDKIDTGEALVIALTSGAVYAALWSIFAVIVARMLARVDAAARREDKS